MTPQGPHREDGPGAHAWPHGPAVDPPGEDPRLKILTATSNQHRNR